MNKTRKNAPAKHANAAPRGLGEDLRITKTSRRAAGGGTWVMGTVHGHRFEALVFPEHAEVADYELGDSRISKLWLQRLADGREVYVWDRGLDVPPADAMAAAVVDFLAAGLAEHTYPPRATHEPQRPARPRQGASMVYGARRPGGPASPNTAKGDSTMKKEEVTVGASYSAKVGARTMDVRIESENAKGGWNATAVDSGKPVRIKDARQLRGPAGTEAGERTVEPADADDGDPDRVPLTQLDKEKRKAARGKRGGKGAGAKAPKEKKARKEKAPKEKKPKPMSALDAAAAVLKAKGEPMRCKEMVAAMKDKGLWQTDAPTPEATLYSAILREITSKKSEARFKKTDRGHFGLNK